VRIVYVDRTLCILSTGEPFLIKYEKLFRLCEQLWQENVDVTVRTWWTPAGMELIEVHRVSSRPLAEQDESDGTIF
jgi:hypothetical protein